MGTWGVEICKDMDFVHPALNYSQQGINIMFVPALNFHDDGGPMVVLQSCVV
jgi:apolipoprotein N-acyltransferase